MKKGMVHAAATGALRLDQRNAIDTQWQQLLLLPLAVAGRSNLLGGVLRLPSVREDLEVLPLCTVLGQP